MPQDPQTQGTLAEVQSMYLDALEGLRGRDKVATENMAFYRGLHWGVAAPGGWIEPEATDEEHEVLNYVRPTVRSAVASMLRNLPQPEAIPMNSDQSSAARALAVQRLARSMLVNETIPFETLVRGETEVAVKGACWYKVFFDPNHGRIVNGAFEGGVKVEFRDIIDVLVDPHATSEGEVRHIFDRKMVALSTLADRFPVDIYGVPTEGRWLQGHTDETRNDRDAIEKAPSNIYGAFTRSARAKANELIEIVEYWEKPTRSRPEGRLFVYAGEVILADSGLPYEWPWVQRNGQNIVPNAIYADGVVADIKSINRSINVSATKVLEHVKKGTAAHLLVSKESKINIDHFDDITGGIIVYEGGPSALKPEWVQPAQLPQGLFEQTQTGLSVMKDVSTYSDISRGDAPAGVETGRALAYLHEFQQGVREPDVRLFKQAIVAILKKCIGIVRDFYPDGRMIRVLGENGRWLMEPLRRADIDFEADIVIEIDSGAPSSRALRLNEVVNVFQIGGLEDTPAAERLRKLINYDYQDRSTIDASEKQRMRARAQIQRIIADPMFQPAATWTEDSQVYLDVLWDFISGDEFHALPPITQQSIERYYAEHELMIAQQQMSFAGQQQALGSSATGAPPKKQPGMASPLDGGTSDAEALGPGGDSTFQQVAEPDAA